MLGVLSTLAKQMKDISTKHSNTAAQY